MIVPVTNDHQAFELINEGLCRRPMASQSLNPTSSRSHLIITLYLRHKTGSDPSTTKVISKLTFVDLAGSERVNKSESKGLRLDEARAINSSLSALADAICHLKYYNDTFLFRNSKLTKSLQMSLMGQSYICVLGMVRKSPQFTSETIGTLNFIRKCKSMKLGDPTQLSYQEIFQDGRHTKHAIQPPNEPAHAKAGPHVLSGSLAHRDEGSAVRDTSDDGGFLFRDEADHSLEDRKRDVNSREVGEFAQFVGMCLINISRMLKKLSMEVCHSSSQQDIEELLSERFEGEANKLKNQEVQSLIQPIPEEMLIDLREAQSVPDIVSLVQGGFKLLIEQIKEASDRTSSFANKLLDEEERSKSEHYHKLNKQYQGFLKEFSKTLSKILNQLIITKFETLTNLSDSRQTLAIMQHFVDFPIRDLLVESESAIKQLVGGEVAQNVIQHLEGIIKQLLFSLSGTRSFNLSELNLNHRSRDASSQTDMKQNSLQTNISRAVQAEVACKSFCAQVSDHTEEKLVGLIEAHRKLQSDRNWIIQERDTALKQLGARIQSLEKENMKLQETTSENLHLKSHLLQFEKNSHEEQARFAKDTQGFLSQLAASRETIKILEQRLEDTLRQNSKLQSSKQQAEDEASQLSRQVGDLSNRLHQLTELDVERREHEMSSQLESLKRNYSQILEKSKSALSQANEETSVLKQQLEESLQRLDETHSRQTDLAAQLEHYQLAFEEQSRKLEGSQSVVFELQQQAEMAERSRQDLEETVQELRSRLNAGAALDPSQSLKQEVEGIKQQLAESRANCRRLEQEYQQVKLELKGVSVSAVDEQKGLIKDKEALVGVVEQLKSELTKLSGKETEAKEKLEAKYKESKQSIEEYGYRIRDLEIEKIGRAHV